MLLFIFFFFNDTATTEIYTLSLHDALPICRQRERPLSEAEVPQSLLSRLRPQAREERLGDRKSTRLNSSHSQISYAVFCLKKKKNKARRYDRLRVLTLCGVFRTILSSPVSL